MGLERPSIHPSTGEAIAISHGPTLKGKDTGPSRFKLFCIIAVENLNHRWLMGIAEGNYNGGACSAEFSLFAGHRPTGAAAQRQALKNIFGDQVN